MSICADGRVSSVFSVTRHLTPETESQKPYCSSWLYAVHHHSASGTFKSFPSLSIFIVSLREVCLTRLELCFNPFNAVHPMKTSLKFKVLISDTAVAFLLPLLFLVNYFFFIFKEHIGCQPSCHVLFGWKKWIHTGIILVRQRHSQELIPPLTGPCCNSSLVALFPKHRVLWRCTDAWCMLCFNGH